MKVRYVDKRGAKKAIREVHSSGRAQSKLRPYRCPECDFWHVGNLSRQVIAGRVSRKEAYRDRSGTR